MLKICDKYVYTTPNETHSDTGSQCSTMAPFDFFFALLDFILAFGVVFAYSVNCTTVSTAQVAITQIGTHKHGVDTDVPCSSSKCFRAWRMLNISRAGSAMRSRSRGRCASCSKRESTHRPKVPKRPASDTYSRSRRPWPSWHS